MEREEYIAYLNLRAQECGYNQEILEPVDRALKEGDIKLYDRLHRISEPEFRNWCLSVVNQS